MAEAPVTLTPNQIKEIIAAAIEASHKPDPLREREIQESLEREKRRALLQVELGKAEEETNRRKKFGCTHSRKPQNAGKYAGYAAAKGEGEWTTGGQFLGEDEDIACLICTRCSYTWQFRPTSQERQFLRNDGFLGFAPPSAERIIAEG